MSKKTFRQNLAESARSRIVQGLMAFALGTFGAYLVSAAFYPWKEVSDFLYSNIIYTRGPQPWTGSSLFWGYASSVLATLLITVVMVALITAVMVLLFARLGLKPKAPVLGRIFAWSIAGNVAVMLLSIAPSFLGDQTFWAQGAQTAIAYWQFVALGLPYTFAWLWTTRRPESLDLNLRKR